MPEKGKYTVKSIIYIKNGIHVSEKLWQYITEKETATSFPRQWYRHFMA